ncbi:GDP-D-glucose phosphorylase 1 [Aricia agestis]|uniref:GDP-D-glucose phosphorylase 1 n=1 Tax=Aricia agestis TaxID=91739 RepID=UPI001C2017DF|nr:GDP-D-glucose phosphorylase 1 [Aricia agestis]
MDLNNFLHNYKSVWCDIYDKNGIFRYKLKESEERILNEKYLLTYNAERGYNRRRPQEIHNICQPFNENKFNFNKVSPEEIMFTFADQQNGEHHLVLVNVSPIAEYHTLLCPSVNKCLPQVVTEESLKLVFEIMLASLDRDLRIAFNSLCAFASVNHLHYHLLIAKQNLPIEKLKCKQLRGPLYILDDSYPASAFCFEVTSPEIHKEIYKLIHLFLQKSIAHNIFITRGDSFDGSKEITRCIVYPRKSSSGIKQLHDFNVAALELSGWITVYDKNTYENLKEKDIDDELRKWKYEAFEELCEELTMLY